jgi:hypothetical protein
MYDGGDNFGLIRRTDPDGFDTAVNYRQPFVDWMRRLHTTRQSPLRY